MEIPRGDIDHLIRDKYGLDPYSATAQSTETSIALEEDMKRLEAGEPLAYVIGWAPFLGLRIGLDSKPLIPRPETEWWTERLCEHIGSRTLRVLDLCAGSGAVGLAILARCPNAFVSFGELKDAHAKLIERNIVVNGLDASRADVRTGDLLKPFPTVWFDIIAVNPPYIPSGRILDASVREHEPTEALFAGEDGLDLIRHIAKNAPHHVSRGGELWLEADIDTIQDAALLLTESGATRTTIQTDLYGRERLVLAYY